MKSKDPEKKSQKRAPSRPAAGEKSLLGDQDLYLFNEGTHSRLYEKLGSHRIRVGRKTGTYFAVWAPDAVQVSVVGDFNGWEPGKNPLHPKGQSGVWEGTVLEGLKKGSIYKYHIVSRFDDHAVLKADPFAVYSEVPPKTGSVVWPLDYEWNDQEWMESRKDRNSLESAISIYEVHLGSWKRVPEEENRPLTYRELALNLSDYVKGMGFTHVELLPIMEHPFGGSWGYQSTGYFAPTSRFGTPEDFMFLVDCLHQNGVGVILDWVPSHFPTDEHGLGYFDGTHLYEHADDRKGFHPDWSSYIFNYGRNEVRSFLLSSANSWLARYHIDGIRVDAVASMLYLDYSREEGEWIPNEYGGNENIDAIEFLRQLNRMVYEEFGDVQTIAEESTAWPMVSRPTYLGGLGFGMKWDMGWMHDTLEYMSKDSVHRKFHQNNLTFRMLYAFQENFVLPLSHDEVVHGKGSLLGKMTGDDWQKFANLRTLFGYMYAQPAKKLLFMGGELGQWSEWNHESSVEWHLTKYPLHAGLQLWVTDLNRLYREEPALHELDFSSSGFEWVDCGDSDQSVISLLRWGKSEADVVLVACNFTPVPRHNYRVGVPFKGAWKEILNSDGRDYGGSGQGNLGSVEAIPIPFHGRPYSINLTLPPLAAVFLKPE
jgi:1,4-alpha-glucan branching enzyme